MNRFVVLLAGLAIAGLGLTSAGAVAAPVGVARLATPETSLAEVRMMRRHHRRMMRRRGSRAYAPSQAGNARDPSRPVSQQNQGQTTGGPRY